MHPFKQLSQRLNAVVASVRPISGGDICDAFEVELEDGSRYFAKTGDLPNDAFSCEKAGLEALRQGPLQVPNVIYQDDAWLVLQMIETTTPSGDFWSNFGRGLAQLHRITQPTYGFDHDNYIGATRQKNIPSFRGPWWQFYRDYRLEFLIEMLRRRDQWPKDCESGWQNLRLRLPELLTTDEPPSLIHGDLWSGNFLCVHSGPVLIDPAVCFAHRELELSMTRLFGGFAPAFYEAYDREWPLKPGYAQRLPVYQLYHLLNHAVLFGTSYLGQIRNILR